MISVKISIKISTFAVYISNIISSLFQSFLIIPVFGKYHKQNLFNFSSPFFPKTEIIFQKSAKKYPKAFSVFGYFVIYR